MQNQLGKEYILQKVLGEGNFGKVFLGKHVKSGENVAIKVLEKQKFNGLEDLGRVHIELKILLTINHPNIVQLLDFKFAKDYVFFIMEYVQGGELFKLIRQKKLTEKECFCYFYQIFEAVEYLHSLNITHRDLKPENLMLSYDEANIKLVDFGLSRFYQSNQGCQTACGSPCYAPPEMIFENNYDAEKAEVWSLGMVLYAMVVGRLPIYGDDTQEIYNFLTKKQIQYPKDINKDLKKFIKRMLEIDRKKRACFLELKNDKWFINQDSKLQFEALNLYKTQIKQKQETELDDHLLINLSLAYCVNFDRLKNLVKKRNLSHGIYCHYWLLKNKLHQKKHHKIDSKLQMCLDIQNLFFLSQTELYQNLLNFLESNYKNCTVVQSIEEFNIQIFIDQKLIGIMYVKQYPQEKFGSYIEILLGKENKFMQDFLKYFRQYNQIQCNQNLFLSIKKRWINYPKKGIYIKKNQKLQISNQLLKFQKLITMIYIKQKKIKNRFKIAWIFCRKSLKKYQIKTGNIQICTKLLIKVLRKWVIYTNF